VKGSGLGLMEINIPAINWRMREERRCVSLYGSEHFSWGFNPWNPLQMSLLSQKLSLM